MVKNLPIRYKLLISFPLVFMLSIILASAFIYSVVRRNIEINMERELENSTKTLLNMVKTSAAVSIKNRLRALAEKNREIVQHFHEQYQMGFLPEDIAKERAKAVLLSQTIGSSGYIYCLDSTGKVVVHPETGVRNTNVSVHPFVKEQLLRKEGYIEYDWKNPEDILTRPKAMYMTWFRQWDWIISVSSYRREFSELVDVDDFRKSILDLRYGDSGYSYVVNTRGDLIIHPDLQGINMLETDDYPNRFLKHMIKQKTGKIIHEWKAPGESVARKKLVIFNFIPEYEWRFSA